jgi:rubrerythrin
MENILEFAMKMEMDGKRFYEQGAEKTDDERMKKILHTLAEEEQRHFDVFRKLRDKNDLAEASKALGPRLTTSPAIKNVFQELVENGMETLPGDDLKNMWTEAIRIEEDSEKLYREQAGRETDEKRQALLNRIADEEKSHIYLIDNMIHYLADPQGFALSQQFAQFKSWEGR